MIVLGPIIALAAVWLMGALALALLGVRRTAGIDVPVLDFIAGASILATLGMTTIALGRSVSLLPFYALLAVLSIAALWRRRAVRVRIPLPHAPHARALLAFAAFLLLLLTISSAQDRLAWDAWSFWTFKARVLFLDGTLPTPYLDPNGHYLYAHPDYPLAIPLLDWWLYRHAGAVVPALASLAGVVWFACLPALLWTTLREVTGEKVAALAALGITAFWPLAFYASGGYADTAIAIALLGTVLELQRGRTERDPGAPLRLALYLMLAALAKNEGLALAAVGAAAAGVAWIRGGERRAGAYLALALPFLTLAPWFFFTRQLGLEPEHLAGAAPTLALAVGRIPEVSVALARLIFTRTWLPLPFLMAAGLFAALRRGRLAAPAGWSVAAGYGAVIFGVYFTTAVDLEWLLRTTLDRMMGDLVPAIVALSVIEVWSARAVPGDQGEGAEGVRRVRDRVPAA